MHDMGLCAKLTSMTDTGLLFDRCCWPLASSVKMPSCLVSILFRASDVQLLPANQTEPGEAVVKGVASSHHIFTVFSGVVGHISSAIVHLSHEIKSLSARSSNDCHIESLYQKCMELMIQIQIQTTLLIPPGAIVVKVVCICNEKCSSSEYCAFCGIYSSLRYYKHVCFLLFMKSF